MPEIKTFLSIFRVLKVREAEGEVSGGYREGQNALPGPSGVLLGATEAYEEG